MKPASFIRVMVVASALWATTYAHAQDKPVAFIGATIIPIDGEPITNATLLVHNGKIQAVGDHVAVPAGAEQIDARGRFIMPGLVDTHSHLGGGWGGDSSGPIQPACRIYDSINVLDAGLQKAQAGGLTTLNVMPGSGHLLSGQTIYIKLNDGRTIDDLAIRTEDGRIAGGMKMANGTNSQREAPFPGTRAKSAALVRQRFIDALAYREKLMKAESDDDKDPPDRDLALEALCEVLDGKRVVHFHTHRADDILTAIRLSQEFGFKVVLHHVSEAWKVPDEIRKAGVACSVIVIDSPGGKLEAKDLLMTTGAVLEKAGVPVAFHTDDPITDSRLFLRSAALAVRAGMSREKALAALTIEGAKMLELDQRIGTLTPGKDADFIVLDGDPLSVYTHVRRTYVEGKLVFDRDNPQDDLYAVGGYGAGEGHIPYGCCLNHGEHSR
ncbi:MAG TPA: amidohydrolase family protein [Phycisphaerae bacterium]|nr:amidohydrolase family protein [Phycisphaerae bacterium]HRW54699.1 amidohydrolase family protein [Phycisphaerae bacterium]